MPPNIPKGITAEDVLNAIADLGRGVPHAFGDSTGYDLVHEGRKYPPKAVLGLAARRLAGRPLGPYDFKGGDKSNCFRILRELGFEITPKSDRGIGPRLQVGSEEVNVWVEISESGHGHGGPGWGLGECLWSPTRNKLGTDRYALIRELRTGDRVIHFATLESPGEESGSRERFIVGESEVRSEYEVREDSPPSPGGWADMAPYYRVDLHRFRPFQVPVSVRSLLEQFGDEIAKDVARNAPNYPFSRYGSGLRIAQGLYLRRSTPALTELIYQTNGLEADRAHYSASQDVEFSESRRLKGETYFFIRNRKLAEQAKIRDEFRCVACGFQYKSKYGELGDEFIEAHHVNPLSERDETEWTDELRTALDEVVSLCANCHRMVHRRRPALKVEELQRILEEVKDCSSLAASVRASTCPKSN